MLGAIALTASYPPFPLPFLSFFAIAPAVLLIRQAERDANPRAAFRWGWWYGLVSNALVLYWMVVALWHFTPLSALGYLATIAVLGLFTGLMFWFVVRIRLAAPAVPLRRLLMRETEMTHDPDELPPLRRVTNLRTGEVFWHRSWEFESTLQRTCVVHGTWCGDTRVCL